MTNQMSENLARGYIREYPALGRNHSESDLNTVFEYVQNATDRTPLAEVLCETKVKITYLKTDKYSPEDTDVRDIYAITVSRKGKQFSMKFGASLHMTHSHEEPSLYDVLTTIASEYQLGSISSFEDFCQEYGYDTDSRKAEATYKTLRKQYLKLRKLFTPTEIATFPC